MNWSSIWESVILPALLTGLSGMLGWVLKYAIDLLKAKVKESAHFRGSAVIVDSFFDTAQVMGLLARDILADGKITAEEKRAFMDAWRKQCREKLTNLSGFYKGELDRWITEQMNIALGKLLAQML